MTRVIRSEAELSRILARPGFRVASEFGGAPRGEVVNTDTPRGASGGSLADVESCGAGAPAGASTSAHRGRASAAGTAPIREQCHGSPVEARDTPREAQTSLARGDDQSQAGRMESRVAHNHEIPGSIPGPATNEYAGRDGQLSLLELRRLPRFVVPMPPTVNEAWHEVPYLAGGAGDFLARITYVGVRELVEKVVRALKITKALTKEHRQFRSVVIGRVHQSLRYAGIPRQPLLGRVELVVHLYFANHRRADIDNRVKPLQDALTEAGAYRDDSQIDRLVIERTVRAGEEEAHVFLRELST